MKTISILTLSLFYFLTVSAQFGTAPDFNGIDIDGNNFHLYGELDAGKPVILVCMATWSEVSFDVHNQHFLEELYQEYGPEGTDQIQILFYEGDANTSIEDLTGVAGNTLGNWTNNVTYPIVDEFNMQLPLEIFAPHGFPSVKIIRPDDYEITDDVTYVDSIAEIKTALSNMITLFENTGQEFDLNINVSDISCFEANDGEIHLNVSGGFLPHHIEWFDGSSDTSKQNLLPGEYAVTVSDALGNSFFENIKINEPDELQIANVNILPESGSQQNGSISIIVEGGTLPYSFEWSTGDTSMSLSGLESGDYYVTITDANHCELTEMFFVDFQTRVTESISPDLILFPNPVINLMNIKNLKEKEVSYEVLNNLGQIVNQGMVLDDKIIFEKLPGGFYQIIFRYEKGAIRKQFIKL